MIFEIFQIVFIFIYQLFSVHFSEPMGFAIIWFVDVYIAAFYYLTMIVIFVFWITFSIIWDFHVKVYSSKSTNFELFENILAFKNFNHSEALEFWWTLVPSIILFFIALPALTLIYAIETPVDAPALTFKIVGHQWFWSYQNHDQLDPEFFPQYSDRFFNFDSYIKPESELKFGQRRLLEVDKPLVIPVETPLRIIVTSTDVIHSWAVPSLGLKMDAIPGRLNQFWLYVPYQGVYYGQCSELCGANHGFIPITVYAVSPENYLKWYIKVSITLQEELAEKIVPGPNFGEAEKGVKKVTDLPKVDEVANAKKAPQEPAESPFKNHKTPRLFDPSKPIFPKPPRKF